MTDSANVKTFAARQRRKYRHVEFREQMRLKKLLTRYIGDNVFWSALSNTRPHSICRLSRAKKRGAQWTDGHHAGARWASDFCGVEVASWRGEQSTETSLRRTAGGGSGLVFSKKCARGA